ncbi:S1 family peptidase [Vallitalea guaymasensis]|uniref:S1 family peptidase n=1 Tax=Vallitalea guaymasensis TaxID=1185412 RepID=UPI000DE50D6E|nr:serine protease [Vallitalea guaymasensis]
MNCNSLGEKLLFTVVRLEGKTTNGTSVGTGFLYEYKNRLFLVTNKHVVNGVLDGYYTMMRADTTEEFWNPIIGQGVKFNFKASDFIGHPDTKVDVAVANISLKVGEAKEEGNPVYCLRVDNSIIPTEEQVEKFISPLEEIIFIGYPNGIWDFQNLLPIIRKGITATPYYYDFLGEKKFLIDASVFPGSSGSPVFIYYSGGYPDKMGNLYDGNRIFFLGIVAQTYQKDEEGEIHIKKLPVVEIPVAISKQMIDLGIVFKASTIIETMDYYLKIAKEQ